VSARALVLVFAAAVFVPGASAAGVVTRERLGRITGYTLDYNDAAGKALTSGHGLMEIETSVEL
jgi:hypothetical protein